MKPLSPNITLAPLTQADPTTPPTQTQPKTITESSKQRRRDPLTEESDNVFKDQLFGELVFYRIMVR